MALSLEKIENIYSILKNYNGNNPYIINLKNRVFVYKTKQLNDFEGNYILSNYQTEPKRIDKIVSITDWLGKIKQEEWKTEFIPQKLMITWYLGETDKLYHFYCIYRRSQDKAVEVFAPKKGIITDFLTKDYKETEIDFTPYNEKSGRTLYPHQEDAVKFLVSRQKAILALDMGYGKTTTAIVASLAGGFNHTLIVCPASMKKTWYNELSMYVDKEDITIVEGKKWNDTKYTIINYDILDNFYKIPKQKIKTKELNVDDEGKVFTEVKEREIVSRSKKIIDESMENSQLFQAKYDLIIIDEAHRLSNNTSNRFKIIADLIKRSNPRGIFELTGTMITNSSKNLYNLLKLINVPITNDWEYYMTRFCGAKVFFKKNERNAYTTLFLQSVNKSSWYDLTYDEKQKLNEYLEKHCKKLCIPSEDTNMEELKEIIKPYYLRRLKSELPNMVEKRIKYLHYEMTREEKIPMISYGMNISRCKATKKKQRKANR